MNEALILAIAAASIALIAFALIAWAFRHGAWLFLLAGREARGAEHAEACRVLGRRMAIVLLAGCALLATLVAFQGAELARNVAVASVASLANNVAFIAFIVAIAWFFIVQRPSEDGDARKARPRAASLDHLHGATIAFAVCMLAVVGVVGVLAAGV